VKIPGILYPESSDFAKRSRNVAWRAAVESSATVEQLAMQVYLLVFPISFSMMFRCCNGVPDFFLALKYLGFWTSITTSGKISMVFYSFTR
jgi:hypothetical protein